jgi:ribonuclease HII
MPDFSFENNYPNKIIAGVDEAGRGPWAGPVVAAAVILDRNNFPEGLNDSKKISKAKREKLYEQIISSAKYGVGIVTNQQIDEINILQATKLAMKIAIEKISPEVALIDGNQNLNIDGVTSQAIISGDALSLSISAASIIAKVTRDRLMEQLHLQHPQYNWVKNSGYGTKDHIIALDKYGVTEHHRKSYAPIRKLLG